MRLLLEAQGRQHHNTQGLPALATAGLAAAPPQTSTTLAGSAVLTESEIEDRMDELRMALPQHSSAELRRLVKAGHGHPATPLPP